MTSCSRGWQFSRRSGFAFAYHIEPITLTSLYTESCAWGCFHCTVCVNSVSNFEQVPDCQHQKSKRVPEKHLLLLYWLCQSLWLCGSQQTVESSSRDGNTRPLYLWNLCAGQEATVRTRQETTDWFKIGKRVCQECILSPCLFNFYADYIMWNARLDEAQAGIKMARRNVNSLR